MGEKISIKDLVAVEGTENIQIDDLIGEQNAAYAATREEVFNALSMKKKLSNKRKHNDTTGLFSSNTRSDLEKAMYKIIHKKEIEDPIVERRRKKLLAEFAAKMKRVKRIKSANFRRYRRQAKAEAAAAKPKAVPLGNLREGPPTVEPINMPPASDPNTRLVEIDQKENAESPIFVFGGAQEDPKLHYQQDLVKLAFQEEEVDDNEQEFLQEKMDIVNDLAWRRRFWQDGGLGQALVWI